MRWAFGTATDTPTGGCRGGRNPHYFPIDPNGNLTTKTRERTPGPTPGTPRTSSRKVDEERGRGRPLRLRPARAGGSRRSRAESRPATPTTARTSCARSRGTTTLKYVHGRGIDEPLAVDDGTAHVVLPRRRPRQHREDDERGRSGDAHAAVRRVGQPRGRGRASQATRSPAESGIPRPASTTTEPGTTSAKPGRFISEDPIRLLGGNNFYAYVNNSPSNGVDPYGLVPWIPNMNSPGQCEVFWGYLYAKQQGDRWGWPYAHCMASCLISQFCGGQTASKAAGLGKEILDVARCAFTGDQGSCDSAWQPSDWDDNRTGRSCPKNKSCWEQCEPLKGRKGASAPPPGPFAGWGRK